MNFITKTAWKLIKLNPLIIKQIINNYEDYLKHQEGEKSYENWLTANNNYHMITMQEFLDFPKDMPFLEGIIDQNNAINGVYNKWVAIKTKTNWHIKVGHQMWSYRKIAEEGTKISPSEIDIHELVPCTKNVLELYNY